MPKPQVQPLVIVVPGITGTGLEDYYPIPPEEVWSAILKKNYERISMHPDNPRMKRLSLRGCSRTASLESSAKIWWTRYVMT